MEESPKGTEMADASPEAKHRVERAFVRNGRGILTEDQRRYLVGLKDYSGHKDPERSATRKKHQIRERISNGLADLAAAAAVLETEEWVRIFRETDTRLPTRPTTDAPSQSAEQTQLGLAQLIAIFIASSAWEPGQREEAPIDAVSEGMNLGMTYREAISNGHFVPYHTKVETEPIGAPEPFSSASQGFDEGQFAAFRAGQVGREEFIQLLIDR